MNVKNTIKSSSVIIIISLFSIIFFLVPKNYGQKYLPNQEREFNIKIAKNNNEARVHIYIDKKYKNDFSVNFYDDQTQKVIKPYNIGEDRFTPKDRFYYVYIVEKGRTYTAKIKNETNKIITSSVLIEDNN
ncbi:MULTISPECIES: hypothetical protein [unclassified Enterococcus]|uniref:hypothetical protein n=1 Tax=unclassified Enterococcus TaxID=2608891 RepID=UPI001CE14D26|nr:MULTISPECIES: hypothetical protein [unclassified Enterococcus]MCA5011768.1 hypothetical protein [Enterococcus sp. S23]MCA5014790.1 hypothetical protein [Enterococcus sp. S22(2020)]